MFYLFILFLIQNNGALYPVKQLDYFQENDTVTSLYSHLHHTLYSHLPHTLHSHLPHTLYSHLPHTLYSHLPHTRTRLTSLLDC